MKYKIMLISFLLMVLSSTPHLAQPLVEVSICPDGYLNNYDAECGYVILPENRSQPESVTVQIAYVLLHSRSTNPAPDPVVYLIGGPGSHLIASVSDQGAGPMIDMWLRKRDVILIDQRGIGLSRPELDCPELDNLRFGNDISEDQAEAQIMDAISDCSKRLLSQGVDLSTYTTIANADDVAEVPLALGYEQANYFGLSYGSAVVFQTMRRHPERIRTAIIEGASPLDINLLLEEASSFEYALHEVIAACNEDVTCVSAYPDLEALIFSILVQLGEQPLVLTFNDPTTNEPIESYFSGRNLIHEFHSRLYYPIDAGLLPLTVYAIAGEQFEALAPYVQTSEANTEPSYSTSGAHYAYWCSDYTLTTTEDVYLNRLQTVHPALHPYFEDAIEDDLQNCNQWQVVASSLESREPVISDIPTLFLSGRFDPITPPYFAEHALESLSTAYHYVFPTMGHGVGSSSNYCGINIILQFLDEPMTQPDASCIQREATIQFVVQNE